jgi:ribosomal protein S27AE
MFDPTNSGNEALAFIDGLIRKLHEAHPEHTDEIATLAHIVSDILKLRSQIIRSVYAGTPKLSDAERPSYIRGVNCAILSVCRMVTRITEIEIACIDKEGDASMKDKGFALQLEEDPLWVCARCGKMSVKDETDGWLVTFADPKAKDKKRYCPACAPFATIVK